MEYRQKTVDVFLKRSFQRIFLHYGHTNKYVQLSGQSAADTMRDLLQRPEPTMICRLGSNELQCVAGFLRERKSLTNLDWYTAFHWKDLLDFVTERAGFFPKNIDLLKDFCSMMIEDMKQVDVLGSWRKEEFYVNSLMKSAVRIRLRDLEPYNNSDPWTKALSGKKVLVIHPFEETIRSQYKQRARIFEDPDILPEFDLKTVQAVQSIAGTKTPFKTWFDALDHMKDQINNRDFDIALIGCGAYGFPLAAHVKRIGKKAVHIGGALQLMFGIMGKRWENNENILRLKNKHWVYPSGAESPKNKDVVEGGCYW